MFFPPLQIFFRGPPWIAQYGTLTFFAGIFLYVLVIKKVPLSQSGFSSQHLWNHLTIGLILGGSILAALPLLDSLISVSGLDQHELFAESVKQRSRDAGSDLHPLSLLVQVLLFPLLKQFFFTGGVYQSLSRKFNPILAIYGSAVLFTLAHFQLTLGYFFLGLITAFLFRLTGTLYASILLHAACSLAGILLLNVYSRLTTLLVFLF